MNTVLVTLDQHFFANILSGIIIAEIKCYITCSLQKKLTLIKILSKIRFLIIITCYLVDPKQTILQNNCPQVQVSSL